jgi:hypothetical protein
VSGAAAPKYNENRVLAAERPGSLRKINCYFKCLERKFVTLRINGIFTPINEFRSANNRITMEIFAGRTTPKTRQRRRPCTTASLAPAYRLGALNNAAAAQIIAPRPALRPQLRRHRLVEPVAA